MTHQDIINVVHATILKEWKHEQLQYFFNSPYKGESLTQYHHTFGQYIRNRYNLWTIPWTPEVREGVDYSPYHPDAVSSTIIQEVWKKGYKV
jgi:hypothetical protein